MCTILQQKVGQNFQASKLMSTICWLLICPQPLWFARNQKRCFCMYVFDVWLRLLALPWLFSYDLKNGSNGEWLIEHQSPTCQEREAKGRKQLEFSDLKSHIFFVNLQKCMLPCMQFKDCYTHSIALHLLNLSATFTAMVFGLQSTPPFLLNLKFKVLSPNMPFLITREKI